MHAQTIIIGNLTKQPELKYIPSGTAVAKCSIAYTDGYGDKKTSHFMDIVLWGKTAEAFNKYCNIGSKVMVTGFPTFERWVDQQGQNRSRHSLRVETMKMLDSKSDSQNQGAYNPQHQPSGQSHNAESNHAYTPATAMDNSIPEIDIDLDEVPF